MKINYYGTDTPSPEDIAKVRDALFLLDGMNGFRTPFETWRNCEAQITFGDDAATTSIEIAPPAAALIRRRGNWRNSRAIYCDGLFRANITNTEVELI